MGGIRLRAGLLFVYHPACGGCREFKERIYQTKAFADFAANRCVQLVVNARDSDISEFKRLPLALSRRIDPRLYPTLVLIAPDGKVVFMDEGLSSYMGATPERFIAALDERMLAD